MSIMYKFTPDQFNQLSRIEKERLIKDFVYDLCLKLKIDPIPITFQNLTNINGEELGGKFIHNPTCIAINEKFVDPSQEIEFIKNQGINYDIAIPYFLVHAIAHECYHYYQFTLEKKLIDGIELTEEEKVSAYLYFICLHTNLFANYNEKILNYVPNTKISKEDLYLYAPIELGANSFASEIVEILGKEDNPENYEFYTNNLINTNLKMALNNYNKGCNLTELSILYSLETVTTFLIYKNSVSGTKNPYLGIDINELETYINKALEKWKEIDKRHSKLITKLKKNNPKNKK